MIKTKVTKWQFAGGRVYEDVDRVQREEDQKRQKGSGGESLTLSGHGAVTLYTLSIKVNTITTMLYQFSFKNQNK